MEPTSDESNPRVEILPARIGLPQGALAEQVPGSDRCSVCGSQTTLRFPRVIDPKTREVFRIDECSACQVGITSPIPENLDQYYGQSYYGGRHWITGLYCAWRRVRVIELASGAGPRGTMVDIGCGDGSFLLEARRKGWTVLGTEINARIPAAAGLEVWGSINELRPRAPFQCVTLWHCLEHLRDPLHGVRELAELLTSDGVFIIAVPNADGWQAQLFGKYWFHLDVPRHLSHFGPSSLDRLLALASMEKTHTWHHEVEYDIFGWIQSALNAVMPAPNILFDTLTRRRPPVAGWLIALNVVLCGILFFPAFAATVISTLAGRGGTIIVAARKTSPSVPAR
jgi:SAM-dependent methyltransferase